MLSVMVAFAIETPAVVYVVPGKLDGTIIAPVQLSFGGGNVCACSFLSSKPLSTNDRNCCCDASVKLTSRMRDTSRTISEIEMLSDIPYSLLLFDTLLM